MLEVRVRIADIDRGRMMLKVEQGKGHKDRYTVLSARALSLLEDLWHWQHPTDYFIFTGKDRSRPICDGTAQAVYYAALRKSGVRRVGGIHVRGKLRYGGRAAPLADDATWQRLIAALAAERWVVYPKPAPADPSVALDYVARYTHKVAIGDSRIKAIADGQVTYTWRDRSSSARADYAPASRSEDNVEKLETIPVELFTRRFLAHNLPAGFHPPSPQRLRRGK